MKKLQIGETLFLNKPQDVNAAQIFVKNVKVPSSKDTVVDGSAESVVTVGKKGKGKVVEYFDLVPMYQACFSSKEGDVVFSDPFDSLEPVTNIIESLGLEKVLKDLYLRKENVHTASLYTKEEKVKVALNFKKGSAVFAGPFDNSENAIKFIQDEL